MVTNYYDRLGGGFAMHYGPDTTVQSWGNVATSWYPSNVDNRPNLDERKNRKAWARWFREFLQEIIPLRFETVKPIEHSASIEVHCRSGTIPIREWKMKLWKQHLRRANA